MHDTGERMYEAELYRLKGELLLRQSVASAVVAETCLHQALAAARSQHAKSFELRAAVSLARLWQHAGKYAAAHALLAPVYHGFTAGSDTADLQEAQTLLNTLTGRATGGFCSQEQNQQPGQQQATSPHDIDIKPGLTQQR